MSELVSVDAETYAAAVAHAGVGGDPAAVISRWVRLGRELDAAVNRDLVGDVLAGTIEYDDVDAITQVVVRAHWDARITAALAAADMVETLTTEKAADHLVELDDTGAVTRRRFGGTR